MEAGMVAGAKWWQTGVIYQIYPRSFQDSNADGVGDINGIQQRLQHLVDLGVDAIWISPIFPSPMRDFGYDVSDYCDIDPLFGSLSDFDLLVAAAHSRGLKVILDFVPNHTSDRHPWFQESRSSRLSPKRDWYVWRDAGPNGCPPNNWESEFGGPAWTFDDRTGQYYYHAFLKGQPDLNWRNPAVREAMCDVLRFWFERGVDGFRVDAIHHLIEDEQLRDNPPDPRWRPGMPPKERWAPIRTIDQPETHVAIKEMRRVADGYPDRVMIGEAYLPIGRLMAYYGADLSGFQLPFNFHLISTPWRPRAVEAVIEAYEAALPAGAWPNWSSAITIAPGQRAASCFAHDLSVRQPTIYCRGYGSQHHRLRPTGLGCNSLTTLLPFLLLRLQGKGVLFEAITERFCQSRLGCASLQHDRRYDERTDPPCAVGTATLFGARTSAQGL